MCHGCSSRMSLALMSFEVTVKQQCVASVLRQLLHSYDPSLFLRLIVPIMTSVPLVRFCDLWSWGLPTLQENRNRYTKE